MGLQKYAAYDEEGNIIGFYDEIDSPVPQGVNAIPISHDEWQTALMLPGHTVEDGALVAPAE
jgi:hypothetical protein